VMPSARDRSTTTTRMTSRRLRELLGIRALQRLRGMCYPAALTALRFECQAHSDGLCCYVRAMQGATLGQGPIVFLHSSDEMYGADRVLLDIHDALPADWRARAEFWLPTDVPHDTPALSTALTRRGAHVSHQDLPILRRSYRTPTQLMILAHRMGQLRRELRSRQPTLLYCTTSACFLAGPIAHHAGVPLIVGHVQEIWSRRDARVLGPLSKYFHRLLAISAPAKASIPTRFHEKTRIVVNATSEPARVVPLAGRKGPLRYVVASRWNGWKGHRTLFAAWDRADCPGSLIVLGGPPSIGVAVDVHALARGLRRPETVDVVGEVRDVSSYLDSADVVLVPSDQPEPFGLIAAEAFSRGRPVVGSAGGGLADIITDGSDGWLYPLRDVDSLATLLSRLTRESVTDAGIRARATYQRRFTAARYARDRLQAVAQPDPSGDSELR
jgi:glycosyltransferase involved in cell wall biosynthesis